MTLERLPFEKPEKRVTDKRALAAYARTHPRCEVENCPKPYRDREVHHLTSRKMGGSDVPENLIRLCRSHHTEWHVRGRRAWFEKYAPHLGPEAQAKIKKALRLDEDLLP